MAAAGHRALLQQVAPQLTFGDRDPLVYNPFGSRHLYVSPNGPGPEREANWLPLQPGPTGSMLRLYALSAEVLEDR